MAFTIDGWVYAKCVTRNGKKVCHPTGYYKFPAYTKKVKKQKTPKAIAKGVSAS